MYDDTHKAHMMLCLHLAKNNLSCAPEEFILLFRHKYGLIHCGLKGVR